MHIGSIGIGIGTCDHITDGLISLHWLRVPGRILYKPAVVAYKVLRGDAPRYYRSADPCRRLVWSTNTPFYPSGQLPRGTTRQTVNSRQPSLRLRFAATHIWNTLPTDVVAANSLFSTFRRLLKRFFRFIQTIISWRIHILTSSSKWSLHLGHFKNLLIT